MLTKFVQDGSPECPLIAIANFSPSEVLSLKQSIAELAAGTKHLITIDGEVQLFLRCGDHDVGICNQDAPPFSCVLSSQSLHNLAELLEPFTKPEQTGYQWLDETGIVKLLISNSGDW